MPDLSHAWMNLLKQATNLKSTNIEDTSAVIAELARRMILGGVYIDTTGQVIFGTPITGSRTYDVVLSYGADRTGTNDSASAIQAAIADAEANGGGTIYFPAGTYKIIGALTTTSSHMRFMGDGKGNSILQWTDTATHGLDVLGASTTSAQPLLSANVAVGDTTITVASATGLSVGGYAYIQDNNSHAGTFLTRIQGISGTTITLWGASPVAINTVDSAQLFSYSALLQGIHIEGLTFSCVNGRTTANKLTLLKLQRCENATVTDCAFDGCVGPHITTVACLNGLVRNCDFINGQTVAASGVEVQTSTGFCIAECTVAHTSFGFTPARSPYSRIVGCRVTGRMTEGDFGRGIRISDGSNFSLIENCTVNDTVLFGIYSQDCEYSAMIGNVVQNAGASAGQHGIVVGGFTDLVKYNLIANNIVRKCQGSGINVEPNTNGANTWALVIGNRVSEPLQRAIYTTGSKNTIVGNSVRANGSTAFQLIDVTNSGASNLIAGNYCDYDTVTLTAIQTNGGAGSNTVGVNFLAAGLSNQLHATDTDYLTKAQTQTIGPKYSNTLVSTGADVLLTTAWQFNIPANTLNTNGQGFRLEATFTTAANGNTKVVGVTVGGGTPLTGSSSVNNETVTLRLITFRTSAAAAFHQVQILRTATNITTTFLNDSIDWTISNNVTVTMQNGSASAGDISFRGGYCVFFGIPSTAAFA